MISAYYRRYWLQVLLIFLRTSVLSIVPVLFGGFGYFIFQLIITRPSLQPESIAFGFIFLVIFGGFLFTAFTINLCRKRPLGDPFRYSPMVEKYFLLEEDNSQLIRRLTAIGFTISSFPHRKEFIRASLIQVYEASEVSSLEVTRQPRKVVIELRNQSGIWKGRIYAAPTAWYAFFDGANLARIAIKSVCDQLGLSVNDDPSVS